MYEIPESELQDYRQKWLEAERELALNWVDQTEEELIRRSEAETEEYIRKGRLLR